MSSDGAHWGRIEVDGRTIFGCVNDNVLAVRDGDMFGASKPTGEVASLRRVRWLTPCRPSKLIALWNNSRLAAEKNGWAPPSEPLYFIKTPNAYNAHERPIPPPAAYDGRVIYEGELGVVIGRALKGASPAEAQAGIFGYTCVNDMTALDLIHHEAAFEQWTRAKSFDGFAAFGPTIATGLSADGLVIRTLVNGRERQNYPTSDLFFGPAEIASRISQDMTLEPGDLLACGTSLGALPIRPGTTIEVSIDGVGLLRNVYGEEGAGA